MNVNVGRKLIAVLVVVAAGLAPPGVASAAPAAPEGRICKTATDCADGGLRAASAGHAGRPLGDVGINVVPVAPPPGFPPGTPCYQEEVFEEVYETATYTTIYELGFMASVCLFPNEIVLYNLETFLSFPNGVQDPRLTSLRFVVRDQIVNYSPTEKDGYSELWVTFCPDPAQPSGCQRYLHRLGLIFNPAWVYPFSVFQRLS
ncbi:hypothetical protein O7627_08530 [Solwaraspora sp. WMMD1047]|uniref:hypothetical protein n=1 Tax=Solwaraspora sp. WMMD1047 TaxID=3016102 RepID=UPI0024159CEB|nr:hypothetical protein [Solwaraspora sp. WMMD1047]MDG4829350.1 hypothetical protein [Solwaraspora sp. WMMD1047]